MTWKQRNTGFKFFQLRQKQAWPLELCWIWAVVNIGEIIQDSWTNHNHKFAFRTWTICLQIFFREMPKDSVKTLNLNFDVFSANSSTVNGRFLEFWGRFFLAVLTVWNHEFGSLRKILLKRKVEGLVLHNFGALVPWSNRKTSFLFEKVFYMLTRKNFVYFCIFPIF